MQLVQCCSALLVQTHPHNVSCFLLASFCIDYESYVGVEALTVQRLVAV